MFLINLVSLAIVKVTGKVWDRRVAKLTRDARQAGRI
jgi:hypothetical protein